VEFATFGVEFVTFGVEFATFGVEFQPRFPFRLQFEHFNFSFSVKVDC
jgi:hypothetical protein